MKHIAVVDVETTGINPYRSNRIVEVAALVMQGDGKVVREFATLVNPNRDIGPTSIHGLCSRDIIEAPKFEDVAGSLLDMLKGCVALAGHNIRFDHAFLKVEFERIGHTFPDCPTLCTMQLAGGGSLSCVCSDYGIIFDGTSHCALHDARATARLLAELLRDAPCLAAETFQLPPITWPRVPNRLVRALTRDDSSRRENEAPSYIQRLLSRIQPDLPPDEDASASLAYSAVLSRVLEDRHVDPEEADSLVDLATKWNLSAKQIGAVHRDYLLNLSATALRDGVVTEAERRDLDQASILLGFDPGSLDAILEMAQKKLANTDVQSTRSLASLFLGELQGKRVCFTGECQCSYRGEPITRSVAADLAANRGLVVAESVTKKLDMLVVADPLTQSGKAKKARQYGIRILHEPVFWQYLGVEVQ